MCARPPSNAISPLPATGCCGTLSSPSLPTASWEEWEPRRAMSFCLTPPTLPRIRERIRISLTQRFYLHSHPGIGPVRQRIGPGPAVNALPHTASGPVGKSEILLRPKLWRRADTGPAQCLRFHVGPDRGGFLTSRATFRPSSLVYALKPCITCASSGTWTTTRKKAA